MKIELDMYQTLAVAVLVLMLGKFLRARVQVLDKFLHSGAGHWRRAVRRFYLCVLCDRRGRVRI